MLHVLQTHVQKILTSNLSIPATDHLEDTSSSKAAFALCARLNRQKRWHSLYYIPWPKSVQHFHGCLHSRRWSDQKEYGSNAQDVERTCARLNGDEISVPCRCDKDYRKCFDQGKNCLRAATAAASSNTTTDSCSASSPCDASSITEFMEGNTASTELHTSESRASFCHATCAARMYIKTVVRPISDLLDSLQYLLPTGNILRLRRHTHNINSFRTMMIGSTKISKD